MEKIAVVGSANLDLVVSVNHLPSPGETILGSSFDKIPGWKGANQAVAASKLGGQVSFIGCIGSDQEGKIIKTKFKEEKDLLVADESKGESIKRMKYDGCPHWQNKKKLDDFLS